MATHAKDSTYLRWTLLFAVVGSATLFVRFTLDPFHLPKMVVLGVSASVVVGLAVTSIVARRGLEWPAPFVGWVALAFVTAALASTLASDAPLLSFVGRYRRYGGSFQYILYVILMLGALRAFPRTRDGRSLLIAISVAAGLAGGYGLLQALGLDPFAWTSDLGEGTVTAGLGNPNFAAGLLGLASAAPLALAAMPIGATAQRAAWVGVAVLAASAAVATGSAQGVITVGVTWSVVALGHLAEKSQVWFRRGALAWGVTTLSGFALLLMSAFSSGGGLLAWLSQVGSLGLRRFYWEAALAMFAANPIFGVGLDRYGSYFHSYRSVEAAQLLGLHTTTDAAHSVPLGLLAQGGALLFLAYLAYVLLVGRAIFLGMRELSGVDRGVFTGLTAVWVGYFAQSWVSIDVPAIAVVNWIIGGAILALSGTAGWEHKALGSQSGGSGRRRRTSGPAAFAGIAAAAALCWPFARGLYADVVAFDGAEAAAQRDGGTAYLAYERAAEIAPWQPAYHAERADIAVRAGEDGLATEAFAELLQDEPRFLHYYLFAARSAARSDRVDLARDWYGRALAIDGSKTPGLHGEVADFLRVSGDHEEAVRLARRATELEAAEPQWWFTLGESLTAAGRPEEAADAYQRVVDIGSDPTLTAQAVERLGD